MINSNASWLRESIVEPVLKAKSQISSGRATDLIIGADLYYVGVPGRGVGDGAAVLRVGRPVGRPERNTAG